MRLVLDMPHIHESESGDVIRAIEAALRVAHARGELPLGFIHFHDLAEALRSQAPWKPSTCPCLQCAQAKLERERP